MKFIGYEIQPKYRKADNSTSVEISVSDDQLKNIQDILLNKCFTGIYKITIEPDVEELDVDTVPFPHIK